MIHNNDIVVICPTFNEAENIVEFIDSVQSKNLNLLIVDDSSPDGTGKLVKKSKYINKNLFLIERPQKDGLGSAYREGFSWFIESNFTHCIEMDADFSHTFKDLDKILEEIRNSEIIIGSRYIKNGGSTGWGYKRKLLSKYANRVAKLMLNSNINDSTSGFRSFSKYALQTIDFESTKSNGYGFQVEMVYLAEKNKLSIKEVPIVFEERRLGKSKMSIKITLEAFLLLLKIYFKKQ